MIMSMNLFGKRKPAPKKATFTVTLTDLIAKVAMTYPQSRDVLLAISKDLEGCTPERKAQIKAELLDTIFDRSNPIEGQRFS